MQVTSCTNRSVELCLFLTLALAFAPDGLSAPAVSVAPPAITNSYSGVITLSITGLTNSQPVQVDRFYDLNGNGVIDAGLDMMVQSFRVTDGQLPLIGGVRNRNVPGDDDGAINGQIQVLLDYPGLNDVVGGMAGNFIFRARDPQSGASLAVQNFSVAQKVWPQGVRGRMTSAANGAPLTNLPAALIVPEGPGGVALVLTDTNGNYSFYAPTGSYTVLLVGSGFVSDLAAGYVTILTNQFVTNDLVLAPGTHTISGRIAELGTSKPLPAVFITSGTEDNLFSGAFSDTNGNYNIPVLPGEWTLESPEGVVAQLGYLSLDDDTAVVVTNSNVTNINFNLPPATALIYGTVKDSATNAVSRVSMGASDGSNLYEASGLTGPDGTYTLGVIGGTWNAGPDGDSLAALGYATGGSTNITLSDGQARLVNFTLLGVTAHLRGQIKDDSGDPISNIMIVVQPFQENGANSLYPMTDENGNFEAGVRAGTWTVALECVDAQDRGYVNVNGFNYTVTDGVDQNGLVLTFPKSTAVITGRLTNPLGAPIAGVTLEANQAIDMNSSYFAGCVSTDSNGNFTLKVLDGTWSVSVRNDELNALGYESIASTNVTIAGGVATANFSAPFTLTAPQITSGNYSSSTGVSLTLLGTVARTNAVQISSNLLSWFTLTNTVLTNATWQVTDRSATNQDRRFYRALVLP